jgi:glycosyltransferase involved in cell wall biosynthesis
MNGVTVPVCSYGKANSLLWLLAWTISPTLVLVAVRVLALTPNLYGVSPGQRSSIELWDKVLRPAGIFVDHSPFETERLRRVIYSRGQYPRKTSELARAYGRRLRSLKVVDDYDAVLVYREAALVGPELVERLAARRKPLIYQLDDPLYVPYRSPWSGWFSYLKFFGKVGRIAAMSKVVIVNSSHHRDYISRVNSNVWQIPSVVDADVYEPRPRAAPDGEVCVGWSGSATTVQNLQVIAAPLREVARRADVRIQLVGVETSPFPDLDVAALPWRAETEVDDLRKLDIGLLPAPVSEWNKRKFYMKLVQYMALGIPAVCSPLGSNPEVVEQGRTGFLADTREEWVSALRRLISDPELRAAMGERAAKVAHERYTLQANSEKIVSAFRAALN